jgi:hypothetical protein
VAFSSVGRRIILWFARETTPEAAGTYGASEIAREWPFSHSVYFFYTYPYAYTMAY